MHSTRLADYAVGCSAVGPGTRAHSRVSAAGARGAHTCGVPAQHAVRAGLLARPMGRRLQAAGTRCTRGRGGASRVGQWDTGSGPRELDARGAGTGLPGLANEEPAPDCGAGPGSEPGVPCSRDARPHFHLLCPRLPSASEPAGPNGRARTCESPGTCLLGAAQRRRRRLRASQRRTVDKAVTGKGDPHGRCSDSTPAGIGGLGLSGDLRTGTLEAQGP